MQSRALYIIIALVIIVIPLGYFLFTQKIGAPVVPKEYTISIFHQGKAFIPFVEGFEQGLGENIIPADNIHINYIVSDMVGDTQEALDVAVKAQILNDKADLIVAVGPQLMLSAKTLTAESGTPVLYGYGGNPNDGKFVASMQRSENNLVGVTWRAYELAGKRLEILKRIDPTIKNVLVYSKKGSAALKSSTDYVNESAKVAGLTITIREVGTSEEFAADIAKFDLKKFDAVSYLNDPFFVKNNAVFQKTIAEKKIPAVFHDAQFAHSGALASYGAEYFPSGKQLSRIARKIIIEGKKPTDIPSEGVTRLNLVLNENTAKKLGITFSDDIIAIANEIIPVTQEKPATP